MPIPFLGEMAANPQSNFYNGEGKDEAEEVGKGLRVKAG